jgi:biopolymer transport protein ExbB
MTSFSRAIHSGLFPALAGAVIVVVMAASIPSLAQSSDGSTPVTVGTSGPGDKLTPVATTEPIPTQNLWDIVRDGGLLMVPIAFCSLVLVAFAFERTVSLRRGRIIPGPFVSRFMQQMREGELDRDKALALCLENGSPVADVFAGAVRKWGRPAVEVEQAIIDAGERATNGLRRHLRILNGVATVSPLLGLLGTVVGMIRAFNAIATSDAMGRPELLASGISQALLTTAGGLTVAIPALICYMFFVSRVDRLIIDIDALGQELVQMISAEELEQAKRKTPSPKAGRGGKKEAAA